jgi:hypothetical protein
MFGTIRLRSKFGFGDLADQTSVFDVILDDAVVIGYFVFALRRVHNLGVFFYWRNVGLVGEMIFCDWVYGMGQERFKLCLFVRWFEWVI